MAAETSKKRTRYSCKCLNIQIQSSKPVGAVPQELAGEPGFSQVYVLDDGITAAHSQLTLRIRSKATPVQGTARSAQFMSLACLICRTLVYRVHQTIPTKFAAQEGPVIPKAGWVEEDVLRTPSGWIEVFEDVLTDTQVARQETSPQFSNLFALVVPPLLNDNIPPARPFTSVPPSETKDKYLKLDPLFLDITTTADPVFQRLSNIAAKQSDLLRGQAEQEIRDLVRSKTAQIQLAERDFLSQVHTLLHVYRDGLRIAEEEGRPLSPTLRPWKEPSVSSANRAAVSVLDFVPVQIPAERVSPETPRVSTLSASIATSTFHHPRALKESEAGSRPSSVNSPSLLVNPEHRAASHGGSLLSFKRHSNDDDLDTATSYRYFVLEDEMARSKAAVNGKKSAETPPRVETEAKVAPPKEDAPVTPTSSKPKRKVTFDLNTTAPETNDLSTSELDEMVFEIEEETGTSRPPEVGLELPLIEQSSPAAPSNRSKQKDLVGSFRPSSTVSRAKPGTPSSLIRPSPLRISASPEELASTGERISHSRRGSSFEGTEPPPPEQNGIAIGGASSKAETDMDVLHRQNDDEIMKVLAAGTPSHRAAWNNGGKAWGQFLHRGKERMFDSDTLAGEEAADSDDDNGRNEGEEPMGGVPGSVPIPVRSMDHKRPERLSLASYKQSAPMKTSLPT